MQKDTGISEYVDDRLQSAGDEKQQEHEQRHILHARRQKQHGSQSEGMDQQRHEGHPDRRRVAQPRRAEILDAA